MYSLFIGFLWYTGIWLIYRTVMRV